MGCKWCRGRLIHSVSPLQGRISPTKNSHSTNKQNTTKQNLFSWISVNSKWQKFGQVEQLFRIEMAAHKYFFCILFAGKQFTKGTRKGEEEKPKTSMSKQNTAFLQFINFITSVNSSKWGWTLSKTLYSCQEQQLIRNINKHILYSNVSQLYLNNVEIWDSLDGKVRL